jgi:hypothetical protein
MSGVGYDLETTSSSSLFLSARLRLRFPASLKMNQVHVTSNRLFATVLRS